jgi:hypothetical protein
MWVTPIGFDILSPNERLIAKPCISIIDMINELLWLGNQTLWGPTGHPF